MLCNLHNTLNTLYLFQVLPIVIFFSTFISMLYYLGVMQVVIRRIAIIMQVLMGTTAGESLNAAGNIFIGQVGYLKPHNLWMYTYIYLKRANSKVYITNNKNSQENIYWSADVQIFCLQEHGIVLVRKLSVHPRIHVNSGYD